MEEEEEEEAPRPSDLGEATAGGGEASARTSSAAHSGSRETLSHELALEQDDIAGRGGRRAAKQNGHLHAQASHR